MFEEHEQIALTVDLPEYGLKVGDTGAIVYVSSDPVGYIVEFMNVAGETIGLVDLFPNQIRAIEASDVRSVRSLAVA